MNNEKTNLINSLVEKISNQHFIEVIIFILVAGIIVYLGIEILELTNEQAETRETFYNTYGGK